MSDPSRFVQWKFTNPLVRNWLHKSKNAKSRTLELLSTAQKDGKVTPAMMSWAEKFAEQAPDFSRNGQLPRRITRMVEARNSFLLPRHPVAMPLP